MAHYKFDLVQETSTSTGAVTMALAGAVTRRRRFGDVLANADTCYVFIEHASAAEWQICLATWNTGHSLTLGAVLASSTGVAVTFSAGTKTISIVAPAAKSVVENNNGDVSITRDAAIGRNATVAGTLGVTGEATIAGKVHFKDAGDGGVQFETSAGVYKGGIGTSGAFGGLPVDALRFRSDAIAMVWGFTGAEYMRLTTTGLGIGVTAPTQKLDINGTINIGDNNTRLNISAGPGGALINNVDNSPMYFYTNNVVRATLNSTGLGIGGSPGAKFDVQSNENTATYFRQYNASTGASATVIHQMNAGGRSVDVQVGYNSQTISLTGSGILYSRSYFDQHVLHTTAGVEYLVANASNHRPGSDNAVTSGHGSYRWSVVYAATGAINTSGRDAKLFVSAAIAAEKRAAATIKAKPRRYKLKDSVDEKGEARARWHFGYVAEDVRDALAAEKLDPWAYAFLCSDPLIKRETYFETATRAKMRKVTTTESAVEIIDGKPVMVAKQVERDEPVGVMVAVVDEAGQPVMQQTGTDAETGEPIIAPLMHLVPEMEEYQVKRTREVDTGEVRLGLRYSELEAFLRSAD